MADLTRLGQAGLKGWREKVAQRAAPPIARKTGVTEDQARALIGGLFFVLAAAYVARTARSLAGAMRSG